MSTVIKIENLSKLYRLGQIGTGTLSHDLNRWWRMNLLGQPDPYTKVGQTNILAPLNPPKGGKANSPSHGGGRGEAELVWALKDINLEVKQGEVLGIIGKNGAGKSTLLKILSKVTSPTTGSIKVKGRIASLLEVGTGFHPEMTGRENIYVNGTIMGMRKWEIDKKLDEIVDFAGVAKYIDTPVKRYSSGMTVRLGFAVAAHLEPEILVVDEVLAVGDAEFQKKAIGKMQEVSQGQGRTVIFVSHNMTAIANLCNNLYVLQNGTTVYNGNVNEGIEYYLSSANNNKESRDSLAEINLPDDEYFKLKKLNIYQKGSNANEFYTKDEIIIEYEYFVKKKISGLRIGFDLIDSKSGLTLFRTFHDDIIRTETFEIGNYKSTAIIPSNFLKPGSYIINIAIGIHNVKWISFEKVIYPFSIINIDGLNKQYADNRPGVIMPKIDWINSETI